MSHFERLSALDAAFLEIESPDYHMHGTVQMIFDAGPLKLAHGGIDFARIRDFIAASVQHMPHYLQRIDHVPMQRQPVWVDDDRFDIDYHLRHEALPRPGSITQLGQLVGRIISQRLDHRRPLWEIWIVEGLEGDRFALVGKAHHCIMDGITGVNVIQQLLRSVPAGATAQTVPESQARPAPGPGELLADEIKRTTKRVRAMWKGLRKLYEDPQTATDTLLSAAQDASTALGTGLAPASSTPLNPRRIGPHRRVDWLLLDLQTVQRIRAALGGTVNDVILATMTGALRSFFDRRGLDLDAINFRVLVPVSRHDEDDQNDTRLRAGNRVSIMLVRLPLSETDPGARFEKVLDETHQTKRSGQHRAAGRISDFGDWVAPVLVGQGIRLISLFRPYNLVITNVPGPTEPLGLLGCRLREIHPFIPLYLGQALGIALFSYDGTLFCGMTVDRDVVSEGDLHQLTAAVRESFDELTAAAEERAGEQPNE